MTAPLYPKGAPVFFALLAFLAFLELAGFYMIYSDVLGHMQRNLDDELERLRASGARADGIVEELRLANFRLREMSHTDELTEVGNRRSFDLRVREEISRSSRFGHAFSLLMIDIDGFKKFNDEFGHPKGDAVLRALGALMRSASREGDVPCRVGGEEFAFILPETGKADGLVFAERFRRRVESSVMAPGQPEPDHGQHRAGGVSPGRPEPGRDRVGGRRGAVRVEARRSQPRDRPTRARATRSRPS